ncbi:MAG: MerR family transcriptional regulator [Myxococcota bacterium]
MPQKPRKLYYKIGEVAEMLGVKTHVLRYWETEFPALRPLKTRGSHRMYSKDDIRMAALIRQLVHDDGYTIAGAKRRLRELRRAEKQSQKQAKRDRSETPPDPPLDQTIVELDAPKDSEPAPVRRQPSGTPTSLDPKHLSPDQRESRLRKQAADRKVAYRAGLLAVRASLVGLLDELDAMNEESPSELSATVDQVVPSSVPVRNR